MATVPLPRGRSPLFPNLLGLGVAGTIIASASAGHNLVAFITAVGGATAAFYYAAPVGGNSWRHRLDHAMGWNMGGRVLTYHGEDGRMHQGLWCDHCGQHLRHKGEVGAISPKLGEALVKPQDALSLVKRIAFYTDHLGAYQELSGAQMSVLEDADMLVRVRTEEIANQHAVEMS